MQFCMHFYIITMRQIYLLILLMFVGSFSYANNVDSLINKFKNDELTESDSILYNLSHNISYQSNVPDIKLLYAQKAIKYSTKWGITKYIAGSKFIESSAYIKLGNYAQAIKSLYESIKDIKRESFVLSNLASVYQYNKQFQLAEENFKQSILILRNVIDAITDSSIYKVNTLKLGIIILNEGELYRSEEMYTKALECYNEADSIFISLNNEKCIAYAKGNIGLVYAAQDKLDMAMKNLDDAIAYLEQQNDNYAVSSYLDGLAEVYLKQNKLRKSLVTSQKSLKLAQDYGLKEQIRDASYRLSIIYNKLHRYFKAFVYQKQYAVYKDSLNNEETTRQIVNLQTQYEIVQKQSEVNEAMFEKNTYLVIVIGLACIAFLLIVMIFFLLRNSRRRKEKNKLLHSQNKRLANANSIKNSFFSILSQDLRSPLAAFCSYTEVLSLYAEDKDFRKIEEVADDMQTNSNNLLDLLDNLLQWGVHQMNTTDMAPSDINVQELVQMELNHLQNISRKKTN